MKKDKKNVLKTKGITAKGKGIKNSYDYKADNFQRKDPTMSDVGIGSAFAVALTQTKAEEISASRKIPGNLGYRKQIGTRADVATTAAQRGRKMLTNGKK